MQPCLLFLLLNKHEFIATGRECGKARKDFTIVMTCIIMRKKFARRSRLMNRRGIPFEKLNSNDIARLAGVSRSTVSRVINGYDNVPEETREKVMKVIRENQYYPMISGRLLSGGSTKTIGLFRVGRPGLAIDSLSSNYFMHMIDAATRRGYLVLSSIIPNLTDKANANHVRKIFMEGRIDAGLFVGVDNNEPLIDELTQRGMVMGLFDYYHEYEDTPNRLTVNFDPDAGEKAIDYLYSLGHRRIAVIDGNFCRISCLHRHESYLRGLIRHNLPIHNKWMASGGIVSEDGEKAAMQMLSSCMDDLPTAICANNDSVAFGVYRACRKLGLDIPGRISVIGNDGHENGLYSQPALTTLATDFRKMFSSLIDRVVDTLEKKEEVPQNVFMPSVLTERGSCRRLEG